MNRYAAVAEQFADAFYAVRVRATRDLARALTTGDSGNSSSPAAVNELGSLVRRYLDDGPGVLLLTGLPPDQEHGKRAVLAISHMLGRPLPQDREGTLVREVRDRGTSIGEGARARYSDSRYGGNLHTDGAESPLPVPDIFTLFCVRQSRRGGALEFLHVRDLENALSATPEVVQALHSNFYFDRRGDHDAGELPATPKPVLFTQRGRPSITYMRSYVERGHDHAGVPPLTKEQRKALDALDAVIASRRLTQVGKLREGELALFDNLSVLHGRREFHDAPEHSRLLLRTWVSRTTGGVQ